MDDPTSSGPDRSAIPRESRTLELNHHAHPRRRWYRRLHRRAAL